MGIIIDPPSRVGNDLRKNQAEIVAYLQRLCSQLNDTLNNLDMTNFAQEEAEALQSVLATTSNKTNRKLSDLERQISNSAYEARQKSTELSSRLSRLESESAYFRSQLNAMRNEMNMKIIDLTRRVEALERS